MFQDAEFASYRGQLQNLQIWIESGGSLLPSLITAKDLEHIVQSGNFGPVFESRPELLRTYGQTDLIAFEDSGNGSYHFYFALSYPVLHNLDNIFTVYRVMQTGYIIDGNMKMLQLPNKVVIKDNIPHTFNCDLTLGLLCKVLEHHIRPVPCFVSTLKCLSQSVELKDRSINIIDMCLLTSSERVEVFPRLKQGSEFLSHHERGVYFINWTLYSEVKVHQVPSSYNIFSPDFKVTDVSIIHHNYSIPVTTDDAYIDIISASVFSTFKLYEKVVTDVAKFKDSVRMIIDDEVGNMSLLSMMNQLEMAVSSFFSICIILVIIYVVFVSIRSCWEYFNTIFERDRRNVPDICV